MPFQHYLPATYIAGFSREKEKRRRERIIAVGDRLQGKIWEDKAKNVGGVNNLYVVDEDTSPSSLDVDKQWSFYEAPLARSLEKLIKRDIDAESWARIVVPFVAGLFVRGPDFSSRYLNRLASLVGPLMDRFPLDTTVNVSRLFEFQILLANILAAKWIVAEVDGEEDLITNDLGYVPFTTVDMQEVGIAVPIGPRHVIQVIPRGYSKAAIVRDETWVPNLDYVVLARNNHISLNQVLAGTAQRYIFASEKDIVRKYLMVDSPPPPPLEPHQLGFRFGGTDTTKYVWYKFVSMVSVEPHKVIQSGDFSWPLEILGSGPSPAIMFVSSALFDNSTGVFREGDSIYVMLNDPLYEGAVG